jgi:hypothetical protein
MKCTPTHLCDSFFLLSIYFPLLFWCTSPQLFLTHHPLPAMLAFCPLPTCHFLHVDHVLMAPYPCGSISLWHYIHMAHQAVALVAVTSALLSLHLSPSTTHSPQQQPKITAPPKIRHTRWPARALHSSPSTPP